MHDHSCIFGTSETIAIEIDSSRIAASTTRGGMIWNKRPLLILEPFLSLQRLKPGTANLLLKLNVKRVIQRAWYK